jgi:hypothetical protein
MQTNKNNMETLTITYSNGNKTTYVLIPQENNLPIAYYEDTPPEIIQILEGIRLRKERVIFDFGDPKTGQSWGESHDVQGYIGLSRGGDARYPILLPNKRSPMGDLISTNRIVKITAFKGIAVIYEHPTYKPAKD